MLTTMSLSDPVVLAHPQRRADTYSFRLHDASPPTRRLNAVLVRIEDKFLVRIIGLRVLQEVVGAGGDDTSLTCSSVGSKAGCSRMRWSRTTTESTWSSSASK